MTRRYTVGRVHEIEQKRSGSWTPNRFATRTESAMPTSYFVPNSTGSLTLPRTIGRTYGWVALTIRSATRCFFSSNIWMMSDPSAMRADAAGRPRLDLKSALYSASTAAQSIMSARMTYSSFGLSFIPQDWLNPSKVSCCSFELLYRRLAPPCAGMSGAPIGFVCTLYAYLAENIKRAVGFVTIYDLMGRHYLVFSRNPHILKM